MRGYSDQCQFSVKPTYFIIFLVSNFVPVYYFRPIFLGYKVRQPVNTDIILCICLLVKDILMHIPVVSEQKGDVYNLLMCCKFFC